MTRVAVVGPGAIGATVAAAVRRAGADLVLCGRTPHERLVVEREGGGTEIVPGPVLTDPNAATPVDVVLVAVKAHQTEAAAPFLRALTRDETVVAVLQNGVEQRSSSARTWAGLRSCRPSCGSPSKASARGTYACGATYGSRCPTSPQPTRSPR